MRMSRMEEGRIREKRYSSRVILFLTCRARKLESKHKSMPTKRELYQKVELISYDGKATGRQKEAVFSPSCIHVTPISNPGRKGKE